MHPALTFGRGYGLSADPSTPTLAKLVAAAVPPTCPAGKTVDPTGEYCFDPSHMPPSPPCAGGSSPDATTKKYCESVSEIFTSASSGCPMTPAPGGGSVGWDYFPDYKACFPQGFMGSDTPPDGAACPDRAPIYDSESRLCLYPGINLDMPGPGAAPPSLPTCPNGGTWTTATGHCIAAPATDTGSSSKGVGAGTVAVGVGAAALVVFGLYKATR